MKAEFRLDCTVPNGLSVAELEACLREEMATLCQILGAESRLTLFSSVDRAPRRKILVRVPVVVADDAQWNATACSSLPAHLCQQAAANFFEDKLNLSLHTVWLSGELPVPENLSVKGALRR